MVECDGESSMVDALKLAADSIAKSMRLLSNGDPQVAPKHPECFVSVPASVHFGSKAIADGLGRVAEALHEVAAAIRESSE